MAHAWDGGATLRACSIGLAFFGRLAFLASMSQPEVIVCRPTKWFFWRVLLMLAMFAGFAAYFFYDYKVGYPAKNLTYFHYRSFYDAGQAWKDEANRPNWESYAASQKMVAMGKDKSGADFEEELLLPAGTELNQPWPEILQDEKAMASNDYKNLWSDYAREKRWPEHVDIAEDYYSQKTVKNQMYWGLGCAALSLVALVVYFRTRGRLMKADDEAFYATDGTKIPYGAIKRIDKRKWETKGLATVYYGEEGSLQKTKVDGMIYGQFKEEDGAPAEALFQRILANFSGELVEVLPLDDEEEVAVDKEIVTDEEGNSVEPEKGG